MVLPSWPRNVSWDEAILQADRLGPDKIAALIRGLAPGLVETADGCLLIPAELVSDERHVIDAARTRVSSPCSPGWNSPLCPFPCSKIF